MQFIQNPFLGIFGHPSHMSLRKKRDKPPADDSGGEIFSTSTSPFARACWTCDANLSDQPYVKCIKCPEMDQCLQCFSTAATCEGHSTDHPFVLMDHVKSPLVRADWTTEEEGLLLFGIRMCGVGNWNDISRVIMTKSARECEQHYYAAYIESETAPLPPKEMLPRLVPEPPLPYDTTPRDSRPSIAHEYNLRMRGKDKATTPGEFAGWMPKRNEFDIEFVNEAEELISEITFNEKTETEASLKFKIQQMLSYNVHLRERHRRTEIALEWGLLDRQVNSLGGTTPEEIQIEQQMLPMAQAIPKKEIINLAEAMHEEQRLQRETNMLINWRKNGIMTLDEGYLFNKLQALLQQKHVSDNDVQEWNDQISRAMKTPGFRAHIEKEILTNEENYFVNSINISPVNFLKLKDLLIREYESKGHLDKNIVGELLIDSDPNLIKVYEFLEKKGFFISISDLSANKIPETNNTESNENNIKNEENEEKSNII